MSLDLVFDAALALLIAAMALMAIRGGDLMRAIAFFVGFGVMLSLAWVRLGAVDVALAETAIGAGLTGVLLLGAWSVRKRRRGGREGGAIPEARFGAAVVSAGLTIALIAALTSLPPVEAGLSEDVAGNLSRSGMSNAVTGVLLDFRAFDTLLESVVLLVALIAVWALTPQAFWGGLPGPRQHARADGVMANFGRILPPLGLIVGVYLVWVGSSQPGGAFQAGTVIAAVWLLVVMSGNADEPRVSSLLLRAGLVAGPGLFLAIGAATLLRGAFIDYPDGAAYGLILAIEYALTLSIAVTLALLVAGVPRRRA